MAGIDWTKSMKQTFEFYEVDPDTWKDRKMITDVESCTISRDSTAETLGSATIDCPSIDYECYVRVYLIAIQNGIKQKEALGTYIVQTPSTSFDGRRKKNSQDAYTPLIELKEKLPSLGYTFKKGSNIMDLAASLANDNMRAPVIFTTDDKTLYSDYIANTDDTWLSALTGFISKSNHTFDIDAYGNVGFSKFQPLTAMQPVWIFDDGNSSILEADISMSRDLYGIPNVVEVIYTTPNSQASRIVKVENRDPNSPVSIINRGREIHYRQSGVKFDSVPTEQAVRDYANNLMKQMSTMEYEISYSHGYCPVRVGDCVMLNYTRAGIRNTKAKVISQSINCSSGCIVNETATFTYSFWEG